MVPLRRGKIINFCSLLTFQGGLTVPAYAAAKGALGQLTKALANEWSKENVQVNGICPGYIKTDMCVACFAILFSNVAHIEIQEREIVE
jgi:2-dehydro-3-deoxy-D-gluconate 5-dehydrogenase